MNENNLDIVLNSQYQRSINFKEIPAFLATLDNRNRACHCHPIIRLLILMINMIICYLYRVIMVKLLFIISLPNFITNIEPSIIDTCELFATNLCLSLKSFTVYEYDIVVRVCRFEQ